MEQLDQFLQSIEGRAFAMANMALHNEADALDVVQDTMIKLATKYADLNDEQQWRALFFKMLENRIKDFYRKQNRWHKIFEFAGKFQKDDEESVDEDTNGRQGIDEEGPEQILQFTQSSEEIIALIETLPLKQQQCFLLRSWEGFSVKETAEAMEIGEGSVKTHYHRAVQKIKEALDQEALHE